MEEKKIWFLLLDKSGIETKYYDQKFQNRGHYFDASLILEKL